MTENDKRAEWAKRVDSFGPDARLTSGAESQARTRAELEAALGGSEELVRVLRGRPSLKGAEHLRGEQSPKVTVRLTPQLDAALLTLTTLQHRGRSEVVRDALEEYAARHSA